MMYIVPVNPVENLANMLWEPYARRNPAICKPDFGRRRRFQPFPTRRFGGNFVSKLFEDFSDDEDSDSDGSEREWCFIIPESKTGAKVKKSKRLVKEPNQDAAPENAKAPMSKNDNDELKQASKMDVPAEKRERIVAIKHQQKPEKFSVNLDVKGYKPDDIVVKIRDRTVLIDARREETDPGTGVYIQRELHRHYSLPEHVDPDAVVSSLDALGVLTIEVPQNELSSVEENSLEPQKDPCEMAVDGSGHDSASRL